MARPRRNVRKPARRTSSLDTMSYRELLDLQSNIANAIESKRREEKKMLANKLEKLAASSGFSLPEILGRRQAGAKVRGGSIRYRHPSNPSLTWSGRGRRPKWLNEAGKDIERFRVA